MIRSVLFAGALAAASLAAPAMAQQRAPVASGPTQGQAFELGTFGDWIAYSTQSGRNKVCYVLSRPKERLPAGLNRDPGFIFITTRPGEGVREEVSFVLGYPASETAPSQATVGTTNFALAPKGNNAWIANAAEEGNFVEAARRAQSVTVRATSRRGNATTDRYSLSGLSQALERMRRECA
jgi:hypothetical protein